MIWGLGTGRDVGWQLGSQEGPPGVEGWGRAWLSPPGELSLTPQAETQPRIPGRQRAYPEPHQELASQLPTRPPRTEGPRQQD